MGARIRAHDWLATPFGSPATWPQSLRLAVSMMLGSSFGTAIYWGPDLRLLYNDAWAAQTAVKPSETLGRPAAEVWADIWRIIGPRISRTFETGEGISDHDRMLPLRRGGTVTETWWTYSLTPIRETDGAVSGLFNQADETTGRVLSRRRDAFLLDLDDLLSVAGDPVDAVRNRRGTPGARGPRGARRHRSDRPGGAGGGRARLDGARVRYRLGPL